MDDTLYQRSLREELQTAKQLEFDITSITMEDCKDSIDTENIDGISIESESEDSTDHSAQTSSSSPQVTRGKRITDFFSPTTKAFIPKRLDSDDSSSGSSNEVSQALENLSSSMERLHHLQ